jgi:hypothetical protein
VRRKSSVTNWWNGQLARQIIVHVRCDLWNVPRYLLRYLVLTLALYGLLGLWDARGDGHLPMLLPLRGTDPSHHSSLRCVTPKTDDSARWLGLSPALAILKEVNPVVATWVRQQHDRGALAFSDQYCGNQENWDVVAKYDLIQRKLTVYRGIFAEDDGTVAAILCHEFRHSCQNSAKVFRYMLSMLLTAHGDASIVENDAELYEHEARLAIFRR